MKCAAFLLALFLAFASPTHSWADDESPAISITSPDQAETYAFNTIKAHVLVWDRKKHLLMAHIVFSPVDSDDGPTDDDAHDFRLPGVSFDPATGLFSAISCTGESIPVAKLKKTLFLTTIETLPNAVVRIRRFRSHVEVVLEAIPPGSPLLRTPPPPPGATHAVDIRQIIH